jgi:hypothetical protein
MFCREPPQGPHRGHRARLRVPDTTATSVTARAAVRAAGSLKEGPA